MTFCLQHLYNDIHKMVIIFWNMTNIIVLCKYLVVLTIHLSMFLILLLKLIPILNNFRESVSKGWA